MIWLYDVNGFKGYFALQDPNACYFNNIKLVEVRRNKKYMFPSKYFLKSLNISIVLSMQKFYIHIFYILYKVENVKKIMLTYLKFIQ